MPILLKQELPNHGEVGIWRIDETESYFHARLDLHAAERAEIEQLNDRKRLEWLASRYLLHLMSGRLVRGACLKDVHGKPYLQDSDYHISMSHSRDLVSVIASPDPVGVDIQVMVSKIRRIAHKYLTDQELQRIDSDHEMDVLHVLWGAKECLYKAYGKRGLDFRQHIWTDPVVYDPLGCQLIGGYQKDSAEATFDIFARLVSNYMLVYAVADH